MSTLTDRWAKQIAGTLDCPDRVVIPGTLPTACYADGMTRFLTARKVRIFDDPQFAKPLKNDIHENAKRIAREAASRSIHPQAERVPQRRPHPGGP